MGRHRAHTALGCGILWLTDHCGRRKKLPLHPDLINMAITLPADLISNLRTAHARPLAPPRNITILAK